jgi:hypothetical protein
MTPESQPTKQEIKESYKVLSRYKLEKWKWIYRVFINLWLNNHSNKKDYVQKVDLAIKKNGISISEWDDFILDTDFKLHLKRNWKVIFEMSLNEKPKITSKEAHKHIESYKEDDRMLHILDDLTEKQRDDYLKLTLTNLYWELPNEDELSQFSDDLLVEESLEYSIWKADEITRQNQKSTVPQKIPQRHEQYSSQKIKEAPVKTEKTPKKEIPKTGKLPLISEEYRARLLKYVKKINEKFLPNYKFVEEMWKKYNIDPALLIAIMTNDSTLWKSLKSSFNYWNVWNDDTWKVRHFKNPRAWIEAVAKNLHLRIESYKEKLPNQEPTPKELVSGKAFDRNKRVWVKFFGEYMTSDEWKKKFVKILKKDIWGKGVRLASYKIEKK